MTLVQDKDTAERLRLAVNVAEEAGQLTLRYFRGHDLKVERKADQSPVTVADREAEQLLRRRISERFGEDGIIGEEFGEVRGANEYQWVLDPIDGTKSFIYGIPLFTTLVAVLKNDEPLIGVIHAPARAETVYATKGCGCWYQLEKTGVPQPARVSQVERLDDSLLLTTELKSFSHNRRSDAFDRFLNLQHAARVTRTWGDGYGYLMVATGRAEIMIDPVVNLWDAAPLQPIIEEAGGQFSDWDGVATIRAGEAVATNARVTKDVLAILSGK